ncbi:uncharacterized protein LOC143376062 isoform X2 [Andrena cerasifolii]|uniref:uncharacterized protein LOC143376062 isoform X2 n=1 Tax=Andrena cerasifolii TaxID=2819439 RepID=UPI0040376439
MKCNSSNELNNNSIIIDEASVSDSEFINELQNIATISNNENFAKTTDDCMLINQFTVDENNLIKSSEPIAISKKLLENNLITSPVILEDDLHTESLINENSNTGIPSDKTSIKDNAILSETSNNNDLLGNNNFKLNLSVNKREKSSSSEKDLRFQSDTHFNNELPIGLSIVNKSSINNSNSVGEYYKLEYEEYNNIIMYPRTVQKDCATYGDENIAPNVNTFSAHSVFP